MSLSKKALDGIKAQHRINKGLTKQEKDAIQQYAEAQAQAAVLGALETKFPGDSGMGQAVKDQIGSLQQQIAQQQAQMVQQKRVTVEPLPMPFVDDKVPIPIPQSTADAYLKMIDSKEERDSWSEALNILYPEEEDDA